MNISELEIRIYPQLQAHRVHPEGIQCSLNHTGRTHQHSHPAQTYVRNLQKSALFTSILLF